MRSRVLVAITLAPGLGSAAPAAPCVTPAAATTTGSSLPPAPGELGGTTTDGELDHGARSRVSGSLGLLTPTGEIGFEYTRNLAAFLELGIAVGYGFSGPQLAVMPRLRTGSGPLSVSLGAGLSGGPYHEPVLLVDGCPCTGCESCKPTDATAMWANLELGVQGTGQSGVMVRVYGGAGRLVWMGDCVGGDCRRLPGTLLPYLGLAIGHTL